MTPQNLQNEPAVTQVAAAKNQHDTPLMSEIIVEEPIAIVFNGSTAAVMMSTPSDICDLAYGFALTEGYVNDISEIESFEAIHHENGFEANLWVTKERADAIAERRRSMAGPVGCGLCGIDSLEQVHRQLPKNTQRLDLSSPDDIAKAMNEIYQWQPLKQRTRSTHAAAFFVPGKGIIEAREDVGRHNALDKLVGALARQGIHGASGAVVMTSRISLELVQKCAKLGSPLLIAASGPTSLAVNTAKEAGIQLVGFSRGDDYLVFC